MNLQLEEIAKINESVKACKQEIRRLRDDPKIDVRRTMFPELFQSPRDG
jgi:hypothetical protein